MLSVVAIALFVYGLDGFRFCMLVGIALIIVMLILFIIVNEEKGKAVKGD